MQKLTEHDIPSRREVVARMRKCSKVVTVSWLRRGQQVGIFATKDMIVSEVWSENIVLEYLGKIMDEDSIDVDNDSGYHTISLGHGSLIDGSRVREVSLAKCNDSMCKCPRSESHNVKLFRNCDNIQMLCFGDRVVGRFTIRKNTLKNTLK